MKRRNTITAYGSDNDLAIVRTLASLAGLSVSEWIIKMIRKEAGL
jgi:hypothetical protein